MKIFKWLSISISVITFFFVSLFLYAVATTKLGHVLIYSMSQDKNFLFISEIYHLRVKYFMSCSDFQEEAPAIEFVLTALDDEPRQNTPVFDLADTLIEIGCNIEEYNEAGLTPLQTAISQSNPLATKYLISRGADPLHKAKKGFINLIESIPFNKYENLNSFEISQKRLQEIEQKNVNTPEYIKALEVALILENITSKDSRTPQTTPLL